MTIVVVANKDQQEELLAKGVRENASIEWSSAIPTTKTAGIYIDLLFDNSPARIEALQQLGADLIIVNAVPFTAENLPQNFIRINGWPGFLQREIVEAATANEQLKKKAEEVFSCFNRLAEWVPDKAGFITASVISMIINEAYFAAEENVSSKEDIDTAMKLGTNYPFGPFEWGKKIGLGNIHELLVALAKDNSRYQPAGLLEKEAFAQ